MTASLPASRRCSGSAAAAAATAPLGAAAAGAVAGAAAPASVAAAAAALAAGADAAAAAPAAPLFAPARASARPPPPPPRAAPPPPPPRARRRRRLLAAALLFISGARPASSWTLWNAGAGGGPSPRAGHSLHVYNNSVIIFGGRNNERLVVHDPRTYKVGKAAGKLFFETYTGAHVKVDCVDPATGGPLDVANASGTLTAAAYHACYDVTVGTYWNDVWTYPLGCARDGDRGCAGAAGWAVVSPHVDRGGCTVARGDQLSCTAPHERWQHSAAVLALPANATPGAGAGLDASPPSEGAGGPTDVDGVLVTYGGYAQLCEDYCSDMWVFPVSACARATGAGAGANATPGAAEAAVAAAGAACAWSKMATLGNAGPGKRWRAASASDTLRWVVFGGHRMWQGFAADNSVDNKWASTAAFPAGGFLDDLWLFGLAPGGLGSTLYSRAVPGLGTTLKLGRQPNQFTTRELSLGAPVPTDAVPMPDGRVARGAWQQVLPREACFQAAGATWAARRDIVCTVTWPAKRANAAIVLSGELLYLFGGYSVPYPYPHVLARGAGLGVASLASDSYAPYPTAPYYYADLWRFDFRVGVWAVVTPASAVAPVARAHHSIILSGSVLLMMGGYASNVLYNDLWFFNLTNNKWLQKTYYPYPLYPPQCVDDVLVDPASGEEAPKTNCTGGGGSVWGEPTRGRPTDGLFGRTAYSVFVEQCARAAPGWDGCRDRADARADLPAQLQYVMPSQRAGHAAAYSPVTGEMLVFGGETYFVEQPPVINVTFDTTVTGDMWAWRRDLCPKNCSGHGSCWYGHCYCVAGFYGIDCSNSTCPGSYCAYDTETHVQTCRHCCAAPFAHPDPALTGAETPEQLQAYANASFAYVENQRKVACSADLLGESNGICDGFGQCQCAPPFLGDDCSMRDCPNNCSNQGWCSVEYPQSRCMCTPPYSGVDCAIPTCLNACSYPNGVCVGSYAGSPGASCACNTLNSPYNNNSAWVQYAGDDCSYVQPFAGARARAAAAGGAAALALAAALAAAAGAAPRGGEGEGEGEGEGGG